MKVDDYLPDNEDVYCSDQVELKETGGRRKGELACSSHRAVFSDGKKVIDISPGAVVSIEYIPTKISWNNVFLGLALLIASIVIFTIFTDIPVIGSELPSEMKLILSGSLLVGAIGALYEVYANYGGELNVVTEEGNYKFKTSDQGFAKRVTAAIHQAQ